MFELILKADLIVKFTIAILLIASIFSWGVIFSKIVQLTRAKSQLHSFESSFAELGLDELYKKAKEDEDQLLEAIFIAGVREWNIAKKEANKSHESLTFNPLKERMMKAMQVVASKSILELEKKVGVLANIGSTAPFVGLLGTVFGIINSFQAIAINKSANLATVAPGIAEALLATAVGLFVAIPAVFFYNIFSTRINHLNESMENFSIQVLSLFLSNVH